MGGMVTRMARVISLHATGQVLDALPKGRAHLKDMHRQGFCDINTMTIEDCENAARDVLDAMREPTGAMVESALPVSGIADGYDPTECIRDIWGAAIDAALQEPKP